MFIGTGDNHGPKGHVMNGSVAHRVPALADTAHTPSHQHCQTRTEKFTTAIH